jgi:hypothetical protein
MAESTTRSPWYVLEVKQGTWPSLYQVSRRIAPGVTERYACGAAIPEWEIDAGAAQEVADRLNAVDNR